MAKARKRLASDIRKDDIILLDRPEVKVLDKIEAKKKYRASPKGALIFEIEDKATGQKSEILVLEDDKIDVTKRPTWWDKFNKWLNDNHQKHVKSLKNTKDKKVIPPVFGS